MQAQVYRVFNHANWPIKIQHFHLFYDKVWYMSFCLIWLVHCYYTLSSYYIDLPFMAHSSSSYCIDVPFMVYSTDSSANCAVKCFNFRIRQLSMWQQWWFEGSQVRPLCLYAWNHVNHAVVQIISAIFYLFVYDSRLAGQF